MRPTQILNRLCQQNNLSTPNYNNKGTVTIEGISFKGQVNIESEHGTFP